jgi:hypothetical protein
VYVVPGREAAQQIYLRGVVFRSKPTTGMYMQDVVCMLCPLKVPMFSQTLKMLPHPPATSIPPCRITLVAEAGPAPEKTQR